MNESINFKFVDSLKYGIRFEIKLWLVWMICYLDSVSFLYLLLSEIKEINDCWRNFRIIRNFWDLFFVKIILNVWFYGDIEFIILC